MTLCIISLAEMAALHQHALLMSWLCSLYAGLQQSYLRFVCAPCGSTADLERSTKLPNCWSQVVCTSHAISNDCILTADGSVWVWSAARPHGSDADGWTEQCWSERHSWQCWPWPGRPTAASWKRGKHGGAWGCFRYMSLYVQPGNIVCFVVSRCV